MAEFYVGAPGLGAVRTASHRSIFLQRSETFLAGGKLIAGDASRDMRTKAHNIKNEILAARVRRDLAK